MNDDHPYVEEYLAQFDAASRAMRDPRRSLLREEVAAHLRDAIPLDATEAEAAAVIAAFGSPAEIIGQELGDSPAAPRARTWRGPILGLYILAAAVVIGALVSWLWWPGSGQPAGGRATPTPSPSASSVVNATPEGPARITTGTAYFEYQAAIEDMELPLPAGAEYPLGVPEGLDAGKTSTGGVMESGAGRNLAYFTWLCAWESDYLSAVDAGDDQRQVEAESMLTAWSTGDFSVAMGDDDDGWAKNVLGPMKFGDPSGVERDRPGTCAQAGIVNVNAH